MSMAFRRIMLGAIACSLGLPMSQSVHGQTVLEMLAGVKFCHSVKDDGQRLKCFDSIGAQTAQPPPAKPKTDWEVTESKSPVDDSPQVEANLSSEADTAGLFIRCKEHKTEVFFAGGGSFLTYLGSQSVRVLMRINDGTASETTWSPSSNGRAAFAPSAVQFIRALPDDGHLFLRAVGYSSSRIEGTFETGKISVIRDKIATACHWPSTTTTPAPVKPVRPAQPAAQPLHIGPE